MTVFDLDYSAWSIAFRILAMGVRSGFVQQQYSKSDVDAASEARKKGHNIAGDMRTQLLDAGENTVIKNALVNMADAIGSSVDAALSSGEVSESKRGKSTTLCSAWTSFMRLLLKKWANAYQLSVRQRAGAAVLLQPHQCLLERRRQRRCWAFRLKKGNNVVKEGPNSLQRRRRHTRRRFYAWRLACSRYQVRKRRKSRVNCLRTTHLRHYRWRRAFFGL
jgi:hypothetical protein